MSTRRIARIAGVAGAVLSLAAGVVTLSLAAGAGGTAEGPTREIVLEARGMAFYLSGGEEPNPTLRLAPAERVRLTLRNVESGMVHDLAARGLGLATPEIPGGAAVTVEVLAPAEPGTHEYVCTLHPVLMRGLIRVE